MLNQPEIALLLAALACVPATAQAAGWTATQESRSVGTGNAPTQKSSLFFDKGLFRIDQDAASSVIIDLLAGRLTFLNHTKKEHASVTVDELIQMRDKAISEMKAQLPNLPEEVRKQVETQIKEVEGRSAPSPDSVPKSTGKKDKVNGYECAVYAWKLPDGENEACISNKVGVDVTEFTQATTKMSDMLSKAMGGRPSSGAFAMLELGKHGFPIRTKRTLHMGASSIEAISELREIKPASIEPAKFVVPSDYKKGDLQSVMQGTPPPAEAPPAPAKKP